MLEGLGVGHSAEQVYRAMLRDTNAGIAELLGELGMPEGDVRDALDELARLSLLRPSWEDPAILVPVNPEVGLAALLNREQEQLVMRQQRIEASRNAVAVLAADYAELRPRQADPDVEQLVGIDAVRTRLEELAGGAIYETLSLMPGGAQSEASLQASRPLDEGALQRGVSMRTVYLESARNDAATLAYARWMTELGGEVRTTAVLPLRMLIVDREIGLVPVNAADSRSGAVLMRSPGLIAGLVALYGSVWRSAVPQYSRRRPRDDFGLTNQERAILNLLGQGHTDEVVARRLAVSVRTCRRVIAELMERLDAHSRFQAGAHAQAGGWLELD